MATFPWNFAAWNPQRTLAIISYLCDAGCGHFDIADCTATYIALFLKKALETRLPETSDLEKPISLKKLNPQDGWLFSSESRLYE